MLWPLLFGRPGKAEATRKMGRQEKLEGKHAELSEKKPLVGEAEMSAAEVPSEDSRST